MIVMTDYTIRPAGQYPGKGQLIGIIIKTPGGAAVVKYDFKGYTTVVMQGFRSMFNAVQVVNQMSNIEWDKL